MSLMSGSANWIDTFVTFGGVTGTSSTATILKAIQVAWDEAEQFIGTQLYPYTVSNEVHEWSSNGLIRLKNHHVTSVTSVIAKHDEETCDCDVTDVTGCSILVDPYIGIVSIKECYHNAPCASCGCPNRGGGTMARWAVVTYVAGMAQPLTDKQLLAIVLLAKNNLSVMSGGLDEFQELQEIRNYSSMSYSEGRSPKAKGNRFSHPTRADMVFDLLRDDRVKVPIGYARPRKWEW